MRQQGLLGALWHRIPQEPGPSVIKNLQILRFFAAACVLFEHVQHESRTKAFIDNSNYQVVDFFFWPGGVDIFFVISGFIMYTIGRQQFGKPAASFDFMLRRIIRVVPNYWFFTTLMIVAASVFAGSVDKGSMSALDVVQSYLFIPYENAYNAYYPVLSLGWTLNYEMFFYVLFAIALLFDFRKGMIFVISCLTVFGLVGMTGVVQAPIVKFWFNSIVLEFVFGIGLAWLFQRGWRLNAAVGLGLSIAGVALIVVAKHYGLDTFALNFRALWLGIPALMICTGLVMIEKPETSNPIVRALVFGGNISFALYLSHPFAINITGMLFKRTGIDAPWVFMTVAMIAAICGAAAFYLIVEKPVTKILNKLLVKRKLEPTLPIDPAIR